jgi:hypothetical protein
LIFNSVFFSGEVFENVLKNLIETELAEALSSVSKESWGPAL